MEPVKILIVEDELLTAERMRFVLEKRGYKITAIANSGETAIEAIDKEKPDLVLMDICLNGKVEGIITAKAIKKYYSVAIIYITQINDEEIFQSAKETFPKNYISKPFSDETMLRAIELAIQQPDTLRETKLFAQIESIVSDRVFIQTNEGFFKKLLFTDILYIKSKGAYADIFFEAAGKPEKNYYCISLSSNKLVKRLGYPALVKVHKSYYVNILRIESIKDAQISILGTTTTILIGREFKNDFDKKLKYLKHNTVQK